MTRSQATPASSQMMVLEDRVKELEAENERLRATIDRQDNLQDRIELWIAQGEQIANHNVGSVAFALGVWWADRPWRER